MSKNSDILDGNTAGEPRTRLMRRSGFRFPGKRVAELRIAARPDQLRLVRALINDAGDKIGCSGECISQMVMAVDEACQNIIRHAYGGGPGGDIVIDIRRQDDCIAIHLLDFADPVDISKVKPRSLDEVKPGGLGTHFIQECMDDSGFVTPPKGAGNCLRLVKKIT